MSVMSVSALRGLAPTYCAHVFAGNALKVTSGANLGDTLMPLDELCLGDVYTLAQDAQAQEIAILDTAAAGQPKDARALAIAEGSAIGQQGDPLSLLGRLTLMAPDGAYTEILLIEHRALAAGDLALYFMPLAPLAPRMDYNLISISADPGNVPITDLTPIAFTRGTAITLADGRQCPVEDLRSGDPVLTRDHGPQPLRWIGKRTLRATGPHAPVVISRGTFANDSDLIVSQHQRLFIYQRGTDRLAGTAEILVRARDLVAGHSVFIREGGFVEYFHLVFDHHAIIYAECIPTESLLVNERSIRRLPLEIAREMTALLPDLEHRPHFGTEAGKVIVQQFGGPKTLQKQA